MSRIRETKITLPCSRDQKRELEQKAAAQGLSIANYLRSVLGFPLEQQGRRKDLSEAAMRNAVHNQDGVKNGAEMNAEHRLQTREAE